MINKFEIEKTEASELRKYADKTHNITALNFLKEHNGLRPKKMHLFLGVPSGGKSTLRNTIIYDFAINNPTKRIFLWLSEETIEDFKSDISRNEKLFKSIGNLFIFSESENLKKFKIRRESRDFFEECCLKSNADLFIFDNITTSRLYGNTPAEQEDFSNEIKTIIANANLAGIIFAHTSSGIKQGQKSQIQIMDIRGNRNIVSLAEFGYVLQGFNLKGRKYNTITIHKNRGVNIEESRFALDYDASLQIYRQSYILDFDDYKKMFSKQESV